MARWRVSPALALLLVATAATSGCNSGASDEPPGEQQRSELDRNEEPAASAETVAALTRSNRAFAFDLYHQLRAQEPDANLVFSPYGMSIALAMTYAGARGETERQMAATLHFELPQAELHDANNALALAIASRAEDADPDDHFRLNSVVNTWGQVGQSYVEGYLDTLAANYGAGVQQLDFAGAPEPSRRAINRWVSEQTHGLIPDLLASSEITTFTRFVLTNALYLEANWATPFDSNETVAAPFHLIDQTVVDVPTMHATVCGEGATGDGFAAIALPYKGVRLSMVIIVPDLGTFESFEDTLSVETFDTIVDSLGVAELTLSMPRFAYEARADLETALETMGMPIAFREDADFSGITRDSRLFITDVAHKATIAVDEHGTVASGASAVVAGDISFPLPMTVTIDRPFIYAVRDATGALLFVGRVIDPSQ